MGTSDITITSLVATPSLRGNKLAAVVSDHRNGAIPNISIRTVAFYSSITNDFATASKVVEGNPEALHAGLVEELTYYYWAIPLNFIGSPGPKFPASSTGGVACTAVGISGLAFGLANGRIVADDHSTDGAVASGALRIAIKTAAGSDPSVDNPVFVAFRNPVIATGNYIVRQINSALSLTISPGSTLGATASVAFRVWILVIDDSGVVKIGALVATTPNLSVTLDESFLVTPTVEGGAGGADSAGIIYASTTITSKAFRIAGYMTWSAGLSTPGIWVNPDIIQMFGPGIKKPGEIVTTTDNFTFSGLVSTTQFISDNTIPQISEGAQYFVIPKLAASPANVIEHDALLQVATNAISITIAAIFRDAGPDAMMATWAASPSLTSGLDIVQLRIAHVHIMNSASVVSFTLRIGPDRAATITLNGALGSPFLGGSLRSNYKITERMA
jgi:hypothetical protein